MSEIDKQKRAVNTHQFSAAPGYDDMTYGYNFGIGYGSGYWPGACPSCGSPYPVNPGYGPGCMPMQMAYLRVYHASPDAPAVDVYLNDMLAVKDLAYGNITNYLAVNPGVYNVKVFPAGTTKKPVINTNVTLNPGTYNTAAAINRLCDITLLPIADANVPLVPCKANIRFAHLSPNAPRVDITLPNGTVLFRNVGFGQVTGYLPVDPGTYTLQVRVAGTHQVVLTVPNVTVAQDNYYTVYAQGLVGAVPPLEAKLVRDGYYPIPTPY